MPTQEQEWSITITNWGGLRPAWFDNSYGSYGNKNQMNDCVNLNLIDPDVTTQGPGAVALTAGTQAGAVTTTIASILKTVTADNVSWAVGGAKLYKISATAVTNDGTYPMTIDKATVTGEDATDLSFYKSNLYIFYNHSGSAGDIAKLTISTDTLDPDWGSTVPTGMGTLQSAPHYTINGGDDVVYFTNGQYVGTITGTTLSLTALDLWTDAQTVSVTWNHNRVLVAVNRPNVSGSNFNESGIYTWNGVASSWEGDPIEVSGRIGALYTKNGTTFVWWQDSISTGGFWLGYVNGGQLSPLRRYKGSLPNQAQVGEYEGYLAWLSSGKLYMFGARDKDLSVNLFQYMSGTYTTNGAFAAPFGTPLISSTDGATKFDIAKASGYTVTSSGKTMAFKMSGPGFISQIDFIQVETEQLSTGAKVDFSLTYDKAKSTLSLDQIAYSTANTTMHKILSKGVQVEDFRLDWDFTNGSTTNPVKIRSFMIKGTFIKRN